MLLITIGSCALGAKYALMPSLSPCDVQFGLPAKPESTYILNREERAWLAERQRSEAEIRAKQNPHSGSTLSERPPCMCATCMLSLRSGCIPAEHPGKESVRVPSITVRVLTRTHPLTDCVLCVVRLIIW